MDNSQKPTAGRRGWKAPAYIMDYPIASDNTVVIALFNGFKWPDGRRSVRYLTARKHWSGGRYIWSSDFATGMDFPSKDAAYEWLVTNDIVVHKGAVTTIGDLKKEVGYPEGLWKREGNTHVFDLEKEVA